MKIIWIVRFFFVDYDNVTDDREKNKINETL